MKALSVMPIRPENRSRYPADWKSISLRIRDRAGNVCEWCGVPNGSTIERFRDLSGAEKWRIHEHRGTCLGERCGATRIVLTVAHLDHTPENCADENLRALCQKCHLTYDAKLHAAAARVTRDRKRGQGGLFG